MFFWLLSSELQNREKDMAGEKNNIEVGMADDGKGAEKEEEKKDRTGKNEIKWKRKKRQERQSGGEKVLRKMGVKKMPEFHMIKMIIKW